MRAARLLHMLMLLQNRGRLSCAVLARELEVSRRTILRDLQALGEAGLPVVASRGKQGGVALAFNYRSRLTALSSEETEALAVLLQMSKLAQPNAVLRQLSMLAPAERAAAKLVESLPDSVRKKIADAERRFHFEADLEIQPDPRIQALATAVRNRQVVRIRAYTPSMQTVHPERLMFGSSGWSVYDGRRKTSTALSLCGDINISARRF